VHLELNLFTVEPYKYAYIINIVASFLYDETC